MKKAVFLDRDGTIIKDKGFLKDVKKIEFYKNLLGGLKTLQKEYLLFIITNQSGISKGALTIEEVNKVHSHMLKIFKKNGIKIQEVYVCPHDAKDNCKCRKPKPFFIMQAIKKYNIDIKNSFVIGDHLSDIQLALNTGAKGIYVLTGHGFEHYKEVWKDIPVKRNIGDAIKYILSK